MKPFRCYKSFRSQCGMSIEKSGIFLERNKWSSNVVAKSIIEKSTLFPIRFCFSLNSSNRLRCLHLCSRFDFHLLKNVMLFVFLLTLNISNLFTECNVTSCYHHGLFKLWTFLAFVFPFILLIVFYSFCCSIHTQSTRSNICQISAFTFSRCSKS